MYSICKIRKILRRATEILIIRKNIREANAEMKECKEKDLQRQEKKGGTRGTSAPEKCRKHSARVNLAEWLTIPT